jgi:enterochelin esterase-like enzyme
MSPRKALLVLFLATTIAAAQQAPEPAKRPEPQAGRGRGPQVPAVVSPEVLPDHRIVFRIYAPQAETVRLRGSDIPSLAPPPGSPRGTTPPPGPEFKKGENGVWEATLDAVNPGAYRYVFAVNGVSVMDPRNPSISESNNNAWSMVYIPGADFMDTKQVPHGAVASVNYYSSALGKFRRMHVYTPPGYELGGTQKYPVFYLLHGAGDCDEAWTSVGRAGFIIDNLIADKKAKPMIVVMPAGHTSAAGFNPGRAGELAPRDEFQEDFLTDLMPYVEKNYRTLNDRPHRAIAGLSMGGGQTLNAAFTHLDRFAYVGVFSSGVLVSGGMADWEKAHAAMLNDAALKKGLKTLWFSTGSDDFLLETSKSTVEMLKKHGFDAIFQESTGAHTWINWRNYLNEFAQRLF